MAAYFLEHSTTYVSSDQKWRISIISGIEELNSHFSGFIKKISFTESCKGMHVEKKEKNTCSYLDGCHFKIVILNKYI